MGFGKGLGKGLGMFTALSLLLPHLVIHQDTGLTPVDRAISILIL